MTTPALSLPLLALLGAIEAPIPNRLAKFVVVSGYQAEEARAALEEADCAGACRVCTERTGHSNILCHDLLPFGVGPASASQWRGE